MSCSPACQVPFLDYPVAQVGVEPTASLGLSKGGLPIAYRAGALAQRFQKVDGKKMKRFAAAKIED